MTRLRERARMRFVDEFDAAQERGEIAKRGEQDWLRDNVPDGNVIPATAADIGVSRKQTYNVQDDLS